jgi:hypothetical protein
MPTEVAAVEVVSVCLASFAPPQTTRHTSKVSGVRACSRETWSGNPSNLLLSCKLTLTADVGKITARSTSGLEKAGELTLARYVSHTILVRDSICSSRVTYGALRKVERADCRDGTDDGSCGDERILHGDGDA